MSLFTESLYLLFIVSIQVALVFNWQTFSDVLMSKKQELTIYAKYPLLDIYIWCLHKKKEEEEEDEKHYISISFSLVKFVTSNSIKEVC